MIHRRLFVVAGVVVLTLGAVSPAHAQSSAAGRIKVASGTVFVVRGGAQMPAGAGAAIDEGDVLRTGADGHVGVTLKDDTRVTLGPASEIRFDRFSYSPAEGRLAVVLKVARGIVGYVSGRIAKLAPNAIRIETPSAILGVRGTTLVIRVDGK
jgi:hypothetical protein